MKKPVLNRPTRHPALPPADLTDALDRLPDDGGHEYYRSMVARMHRTYVRDGQFRLSHLVWSTGFVALVLAAGRASGMPYPHFLHRLYVLVLALGPIAIYAASIYFAAHRSFWIPACAVAALSPLPWAMQYDPGMTTIVLAVLPWELVVLYRISRQFASKTPMRTEYAETHGLDECPHPNAHASFDNGRRHE